MNQHMIRILTVALMVGGLGGANTARAAGCIFGSATPELDERIAANVARFEALGLALGTTESPSTVSEIAVGLDRSIAVQMLTDEAMNLGINLPYATEEEALEDFVQHDGYFQRINGAYGKYSGFIVVASYPGDNEYGRIYGLKKSATGAVRTEVVAQITDGDIESCKITR